MIILPFTYLLNYSVDDSYFYIKTAYNFANGFGSTFDKINLTNGYHPLWFLLLSLYYKMLILLNVEQPELIYRYTFLLTFLINIGTLIISRKIFVFLFKNRDQTIFIIFSIFIIPCSLFFVVGLESQLLLFLISWLIWTEINTNIKRKNLYLSLILSLILLTRIDFVFLFFPFIFISFLRQHLKDKKKIKNFLPIFIIPLLFFSVYLLVNLIEFSSIQTISSKIKFTPNHFLLLTNLISIMHSPIDFIEFSISIFTLPIYFLFIKRKLNSKLKVKIKIIELIYLSSLFFLFFQLSFNSGGLRTWYYIFPNFISIFLLSILIYLYPNLKLFFCLSGSIILILFLTIFRINYYNSNDAYQYALKIRSVVPKYKTIYQVDYSGIISFYSQRKIINGDGLINSFEYYNYLKKKKLKEYFKKYHVDYYSTYSYTNNIMNGKFIDFLFSPGGYKFNFPQQNIILKSRKIYGGLFRKRFGWFYLIHF